jgi:hypothetical protein
MMYLQAMAKALRDGEDLDKYMVRDPADDEFYEKLMREMEEEQKRKADWFVAAKELERFVESLPPAPPQRETSFTEMIIGDIVGFLLFWGVVIIGLRIIVRLVLM